MPSHLDICMFSMFISSIRLILRRFHLVPLLILLFVYIYFNTDINNQCNNIHLPEADRFNTVVNSLRSEFPMVNNGQEPPFIVCFL